MPTERQDSLSTLLVPEDDYFALWDRFGGGTLADGRRCRPGPGSIAIQGGGGGWSINDGRAEFEAGAGGMLPLPRGSADGLLSRDREASLSLRLAVTTNNAGEMGLGPFLTDPETGDYLDSILLATPGPSPRYTDQSASMIISDLDDVDQIGLQMTPGHGMFVLGQRDTLGSRFYLLAWLFDDGTDQAAFGVMPTANDGWIDDLKMTTRRRWPIATLQDITSPVVNTVYEGAASLLVDVGFSIASLVANDKIELRFRRIDANNFWRARAQTNAGGTAVSVFLDEVVAGVSSVRGTLADVLTAAGELYVQVGAIVGDTIRVNVREGQYGWRGESFIGWITATVHSPASTLDAGTGLQIARTGTSGTAANLVAWSTGPY